MSISEQLAAQKAQSEKPVAAAAGATAKSGGESGGQAENEENDEDMAAGEDDDKAEGKSSGASKKTSKETAETAENGEDDEETQAPAAAADPGTVADLCAEAGVPKMAKALIDARLPLDQVKAKIASAADIRAAFQAGKRICRTIDPARAESHIAAGNTVKHVKAELFDQIVKAEGPEIRNSQTAGTGGAAPRAGSYGWDKTVEKLNARSAG